MEIKKENYSAKPWRLLDRNGYEVRLPVQFDHPDLGVTTILQSISGDTRKQCEVETLGLFEQTLRTQNALMSLCRQLYEAEQTKNQQDWTAVIQALEKIGAAGTVPNADVTGSGGKD